MQRKIAQAGRGLAGCCHLPANRDHHTELVTMYRMRSAPDDAELVARCRNARDSEAFGALVERHKDLVFGVGLAHAGDPALAEDVAQEAFVTAWRDMTGLREPERVGSWVAGIARNLAKSAHRT